MEIEPITLDKSAVYYIMSSENTSDTYARPYIWDMVSDYGIIANSPVWCDYSGTRVMTYYGPGNYVMGYPYMATPDSVYGGALTNFKAVASDAVHDGNTWYYTNSAGVMQTGWIMVDSKWYYLNSSGAMAVGWRQVGASWYYFKPNGVMVTGWQLIGGKWYYMHSTGSMAFNQWIETNGKWYYVTSDGSMAVNTTIGTYKVDENGVWVD